MGYSFSISLPSAVQTVNYDQFLPVSRNQSEVLDQINTPQIGFH